MSNNAPWIVMRAACLQEDEGRDFFMQRFSTREDAEKWIAEQEGQYFRPSDYYIARRDPITSASAKPTGTVCPRCHLRSIGCADPLCPGISQPEVEPTGAIEVWP
jgi:hypothetical protein